MWNWLDKKTKIKATAKWIIFCLLINFKKKANDKIANGNPKEGFQKLFTWMINVS